MGTIGIIVMADDFHGSHLVLHISICFLTTDAKCDAWTDMD
jgi:hypothetical protein